MSAPRRLTGGDLLMRRLGVNPPVQLLWRLAGPLDATLVRQVHAALAQGPLSRRLAEARLPLARPLWTRSPLAHPPRIDRGPLAPHEVLDWSDTACRTELDAHGGTGWELAAANVTDGTSVVSLVGSHALTDGQGLLAAVTLAVSGHVSPGSARASIMDDALDLLGEGGRTLARLELARLRARVPRPGAMPARTGKAALAGPPVRSRLAVTVAAADLQRVAEAGGGSPTGLALVMTANILRAARGAAEDPFVVALPVSFRRPGDLESSNTVGMATVSLDARSGRHACLAEVRRRCKAAYASQGARRHLTGYPTADAALSNAGAVPPETANAFGPSLGVLFRTVSGGGGAPGRMNCFVLRSGETVSIGFQSAGVTVGRDLVEAELAAWGITAGHWW
ncbi:hypothetical protein ACOBQX_23325 [Actinokineospora sp. G85]|uniref:hypothetical protein n=1 Tax=Actinokineospora sp. G85 TaxID=3406626 RepID=UPI003C763120